MIRAPEQVRIPIQKSSNVQVGQVRISETVETTETTETVVLQSGDVFLVSVVSVVSEIHT